MLGKTDVAANIAVRDLETALRFYTGILGLTAGEREQDALAEVKSGECRVNLYKSEYAGTNKATALTWEVDDIDEAVDALKAKGVAFEHYDDLGMERSGDVYDCGDYRMAWFKDPDGNILNLVGKK